MDGGKEANGHQPAAQGVSGVQTAGQQGGRSRSATATPDQSDVGTDAPPAPGEETRSAQPTAGQGTGQPDRAAGQQTVQGPAQAGGAPPEQPSGNGRKQATREQPAAKSQDAAATAAPGYGAAQDEGAGGGPSGARAAAPAPTDGDEVDGVRASPMARAIAREHGIDLHTIRGSGPAGRIIRADVEASARGDGATAPTRAAAPPASDQPEPAPRRDAAAPDQEVEEIPLSNIRRVTGRRMVESVQSAPHFFLTSVVDVTELVALRKQVNERLQAAGEETISVNDLIVKACALTLRAMPDVNVAFAEDKLLRKSRIHIGIAVAIDNGLIVPVVRDVDQKSVGQVAREARALIERARAGKLTPPDYTGGTFTVSNLGMFGIEHFTAVINTPEAAILAVGAVAAEPVVRDGNVVVRERMRVTLSVDHRALDGATGARFLQRLRGLLESPMRILL